MYRIWTFVAACLVSALTMQVAFAQALYDFNLPRQSLADSLRAIGHQTAMNILFEPAAVENVTAPAVQGQLSASDAVVRVLAGTTLTAELTATNTLLIHSPQKQRRAAFASPIGPDPDAQSTGMAGRKGLRLVEFNPQDVQETPAKSQSPADQSQEEATSVKKPDIAEVVVTGSLIPRSKTDTVSPLTTISAAEIENEGFRDTYEALRMLPIANGQVQDSQFTGGFTPAQNSISLFGLDPSFTLTLLNGRPLADYPLAFNGASDITDLANIPVGLIDHIDVLTGAASSIYGSSAIAGVVNVVLKDRADGTSINVRGGGYSQGGGTNERVQLSSGFDRDRLDVIFGLELTHQDNMLQNRTPGLSVLSHDNPDSRDFLVAQRGAGYVDPGAATCAPLSSLFGGTLEYSYRPGQGNYCGSPAAGYGSIINADTKINGLLSAKYRFADNMVAYTELLYGHSQPTYTNGLPSWSTSRVNGNVNGYIWDQNTQSAVLLQRIYSPEELGGWDGENQHVFTHEFNGSVGLKGTFGDSGFNYDAYYHLSQENTHYVSQNGNFINQLAAAYYLGPQLGTTADGYPIFAPNMSRFYAPLTAAQYADFTAARSEYSVSWTDDFTAIVNNSRLFSLPAGAVGAALVAQYGTDEVHAAIDPNAAAGEFDGSTSRPNSAGSRNHYALGSEFQVPIVHMLTASLSGRYDHYSYSAGSGYGGTNGGGKFTYKAGLEFRPLQDLLVRANYATAFRTPDMFYLFEGATGSYSNVTDWYQCRLAGYTSKNINQCPLSAVSSQVSPLTISSGTTTLKNITAKSYTTGIVWSPLQNRLRLSIDYDRVQISNKVEQTNQDNLLQTEADCRLGHSEGGQVYDINSPTCQNALALVERQTPVGTLDPISIEQIRSVSTNIALETQAGIQTEARYSWATDLFGGFSVDARYFRQLQHTTKNFPGDVPLNLLCCDNSNEFFNTFALDAVWNIGRFSTTLHGMRYAPTWRNDQTERDVGPWVLVNGSAKYAINRGMYVQLIVNNIFNRQPPVDSTNNGYPYYDQGSYTAYGRAYWLEFGAKFGGAH
jgi:outer membrane receptor protein involved in Fe transport